MLRVIAYGHELNLAHPPRPADPKADWAPVWAVKLRVKSVATVMPGMPEMPAGARGASTQAPPQPGEPPAPGAEEKSSDLIPKPVDLLRGILGR
jgi:hypothetical protein